MWKYQERPMELEILCLIEFVTKFNVKNQRLNLCYKTKLKYVHITNSKNQKIGLENNYCIICHFNILSIRNWEIMKFSM
jgi:hypothetical protein